MTTLDPKSKALLKKVEEIMSDDRKSFFLLNRLIREVMIFFYDTDPEVLKQLLIAKMTEGALNHGSPDKYTKKQILKEKQQEMLDLIGWDFVGGNE